MLIRMHGSSQSYPSSGLSPTDYILLVIVLLIKSRSFDLDIKRALLNFYIKFTIVELIVLQKECGS